MKTHYRISIGAILVTALLFAPIFLIGCDKNDNHESLSIFKTPETPEEIANYCDIYAGDAPNIEIRRSNLRVIPEFPEIIALCKDKVIASYNSFFEKEQSVVTENSLITIHENGRGISVPIWTITEIHSINKNDYAAWFKIKFANGCVTNSAYKSGSVAIKELNKLKKTYSDYFSNHKVNIDIKEDNYNNIVSHRKLCL